jgi:hypothetical protein
MFSSRSYSCSISHSPRDSSSCSFSCSCCTFSKMMSMALFHFLRWFYPLFSFCDSAAIVRF